MNHRHQRRNREAGLAAKLLFNAALLTPYWAVSMIGLGGVGIPTPLAAALAMITGLFMAMIAHLIAPNAVENAAGALFQLLAPPRMRAQVVHLQRTRGPRAER